MRPPKALKRGRVKWPRAGGGAATRSGEPEVDGGAASALRHQ